MLLMISMPDGASASDRGSDTRCAAGWLMRGDRRQRRSDELWPRVGVVIA